MRYRKSKRWSGTYPVVAKGDIVHIGINLGLNLPSNPSGEKAKYLRVIGVEDWQLSGPVLRVEYIFFPEYQGTDTVGAGHVDWVYEIGLSDFI
jgi:hypothetical protein